MCGGTIFGEHGIGIEKMADMNEVFTPDDLAAQQAVHDVLEPRDLCNPGEDLPGGRGGGGVEDWRTGVVRGLLADFRHGRKLLLKV